MHPLIGKGLRVTGAAIALGAVLAVFENPSDMSLAGLGITFVAIPMFLVGVGFIAAGVFQSLDERVRRALYVAIAVVGLGGLLIAFKVFVLSPSGPRVSLLALEIDEPRYRGPCPATIKLRARITVDRGSGPVAYQFRGYSPQRDEGEVYFEGPGTKTVNGTLTIGVSGYAGAAQGDLRVRTLGWRGREAHADFDFRCTEYRRR